MTMRLHFTIVLVHEEEACRFALRVVFVGYAACDCALLHSTSRWLVQRVVSVLYFHSE